MATVGVTGAQPTGTIRLAALAASLRGARISRTPSFKVAVILSACTSTGSRTERLTALDERSSRK